MVEEKIEKVVLLEIPFTSKIKVELESYTVAVAASLANYGAA